MGAIPFDCLLRADVPRRTPMIAGRIITPIKLADDDDESVERALREPDQQHILHDAMMRLSLAYYCQHMILGPPQAPYRGQFIVGQHHIAWTKLMRSERKEGDGLRLLVRASRDHGKSFFFSVSYPIWKGDVNQPGSLGYVFSASQTLAEERLEETKQQLERNERLRHLLPPNYERQWSKREIKLSSGSTVRARGWGVRVRGGHPHWIIGDDILDDDSLYSETKRRRATEYFFSAITNMVIPGGEIVICGTPFHRADTYSKIEATGTYKTVTFPARGADGKALFPERYDDEALRKKEREIGPTRFAREFQCEPMTDQASLFPSHLFEGPEVLLPYRLGLPYSYWNDQQMEIYGGVDVAMSAEVGSDYFVIFTIAVDQMGNRWLVDIYRERGLGFQKQLDMLKEHYARYRHNMIYVESNQAQRWLPQEATRTTDLPLRMWFTSGKQPKLEYQRGMTSITMGKHNLDRGVPSLRMGFENRKWRIPRGDADSIDRTDVWIGEMNCISVQDGRVLSVGEHDDTTMACWMADIGARLGDYANWDMGEEEQPTANLNAAPRPSEVASRLGGLGLSELEEAQGEADDEGFDPFCLTDV